MLAAILAPDRKKRVTLDFSALTDANLGQCAAAYVIHAAGGNATTIVNTELHLRLALDEMHADRSQARRPEALDGCRSRSDAS